MKELVKLLSLGVALMAFPTITNAQVDVDNRTGCDFVVKVNIDLGTPGCPMGAGPLAVVCPAGVLTTIIATPPPSLKVLAYGVHPAGVGVTPVIVGKPGCFPGIVFSPWCGGVTIRDQGNLLVIY
ncbi:MAG: hypothetical protein JKY48_08765 [Flavobacteriales bacterium]|nr:hypothetical protein [Flavobacteriales bacterium]